MWHSHFIIIEMLKTKLFKPNSVYFSNWIFSVTLTTRVEKPPKLERLQNKIPDIKFDFLLLDFIRNKCSRIQGTYTRTGTRTDQGTVCLFLQIRTFLKRIYDASTGKSWSVRNFLSPDSFLGQAVPPSSTFYISDALELSENFKSNFKNTDK